MILPTKHVPARLSLLGMGADVLSQLQGSSTTSQLWARVRENGVVSNYERFVLTLNLLFMLGAIVLDDGLLRRTSG